MPQSEFPCKIAIQKGLCKGGECCGIIPVPKELAKSEEYLAQVKPTEVFEKNDQIYPITEDGLCVFLDRKTRLCAIYSDRPELCRRYGLIEELPCPYIDTRGRIRTPAKIRRTQRQINHSVDSRVKNILERKHKC